MFSNNMPTRLEFRVAVQDRFAQKSIDVYRGFVQLFTDVASFHSTQLSDAERRPSIANSQTTAVTKVPLSRYKLPLLPFAV